MKYRPDTGEISTALNKIRAHKIFNRSPLMSAFLAYVTQETLQGREKRISAYSVAVDALGKPADFDPQLDPSVRVLAKRLRDSLTKYYDEADDYDLCIIMKPGSYVPDFKFVAQLTTIEGAVRPQERYVAQHSAEPRVPWTTPVLFYKTEDNDTSLEAILPARKNADAIA